MADFFANYWMVIVGVAAIVVIVALAIVAFVKLPLPEKLKAVKEWLLYAVIEAEKAFGSGTGEVKLRYVYDAFVQKFPGVAAFISFDTFSKWVDAALKKMEELLQTNAQVASYVKR